MSTIVFDDVWKSYQEDTILQSINVTVEDGDFIALVGASGCGKTTLLKMLLGETMPTRGSITFNDLPLPVEPGPERGVVYQRYSVYPHLTVEENVLLGLELTQSRWSGRLWGAKRRTALKQVHEMLNRVELFERKDVYPVALSGGMQQRLALAQTLIAQPQLLLLDEPFGALDPGTKIGMHKLVLELKKEQNLTVLMVTHDLQEAFTLGSRVLVLDRPSDDKARQSEESQKSVGASIVYDLSTIAGRAA